MFKRANIQTFFVNMSLFFCFFFYVLSNSLWLRYFFASQSLLSHHFNAISTLRKHRNGVEVA